MPPIGFGMLQNSYTVNGVTWNKVNRNDQNVNVDYDPERHAYPVAQYNRGDDGTRHLSIHSGFAGVINNVHYTNGNFNNAKIHYNVQKTGRQAGYSVDWAQVGQTGKIGFSNAIPAMQTELAAFLVHTQIDPSAIQNLDLKDVNYRTAEGYAAAQATLPDAPGTFGGFRLVPAKGRFGRKK